MGVRDPFLSSKLNILKDIFNLFLILSRLAFTFVLATSRIHSCCQDRHHSIPSCEGEASGRTLSDIRASLFNQKSLGSPGGSVMSIWLLTSQHFPDSPSSPFPQAAPKRNHHLRTSDIELTLFVSFSQIPQAGELSREEEVAQRGKEEETLTASSTDDPSSRQFWKTQTEAF